MAIKLFFFDMEGTLVAKPKIDVPYGEATSLWSAIFFSLGKEAIKDDVAMYAKWDGGEYSTYMDWCAESIDSMRRHGLTREHFDRLVESAPLNEGVAETVKELHKRGIRTAIISGGFMEQAKRVQRMLRINHAHAASDIIWKEDGTIDFWNVLPSDELGKVDFVELLRREYGLSREECAFVGDGKNDIHIAKHVGLSFAYDAHPELKKCATHSITNFRDILKYV